MTIKLSNCFLTHVSFAALEPASTIPPASADFARNNGSSLLQRRATQRSHEWTSVNCYRIARFLLCALAVVFATSPVRATTIDVPAEPTVVYSGVLALGGQAFHVTTTGIVELAGFDGPYETDALGQIAVAPPEGSGAYNFFFGQLPVGPPTVGSFKNIDPDYDPGLAPVLGAPYGALSAGFSTTLTPTRWIFRKGSLSLGRTKSSPRPRAAVT